MAQVKQVALCPGGYNARGRSSLILILLAGLPFMPQQLVPVNAAQCVQMATNNGQPGLVWCIDRLMQRDP